MATSFLDFTKLKQTVYIFSMELAMLSVIALIADFNVGFATKLISAIYNPIFRMPEKYQAMLLQKCEDLFCLFPDLTKLGLTLLIVLLVALLILLAYIISLLINSIAKKKWTT